MDKKPQVIEMLEAGSTTREICDATGVSRQYVHQVAISIGTPPLRAWTERERRSAPERIDRWKVGVSPNWIGAASELMVAANLITKGFVIYHCVARSGPFDLIAYKAGKFIRVEVKSIRRPTQRCKIRWDEVDLLAKVMPDGAIYWEPCAPD